jgi:hypothetical protein
MEQFGNMNAEQLAEIIKQMAEIKKQKEEEEKKLKEEKENKELNEFVETEFNKYLELEENEKIEFVKNLIKKSFKKKTEKTTTTKKEKTNNFYTENEELLCGKCYSLNWVNNKRVIQCNEECKEGELLCGKHLKEIKKHKLLKNGCVGVFGNWWNYESITERKIGNKNHLEWVKKFYGENELTTTWNEEEKEKLEKYFWFSNEEEEKEEPKEKPKEEPKEEIEESFKVLEEIVKPEKKKRGKKQEKKE